MHRIDGASGAAHKNVVRNAKSQELASAVGAEDGPKLVLDVIPPRGVQIDTVELKPCSPEHTADPHAVSVDDPTGVVPTREFDFVLNVEIHNADDAVGCQQVGNAVDRGVEFRNHAEAVGHCEDVCSHAVTAVFLVGWSSDAEVTLLLAHTSFMVCKTECPRILANDVDVLPTQSLESLTSDLAEGRAEINKVHRVEERRYINVLTHLLNVPARTTTDVHPDGFACNLAGFSSVFDLSGYNRQHILTTLQKFGTCGIVDGGLRGVEALESILLIASAIPSVRFEEAGVGELADGVNSAGKLLDHAELGEEEEEPGEQEEYATDGGYAELVLGILQPKGGDEGGHDKWGR